MKLAALKPKQLFHLEQNSFVFTSKHLALQAVLKKKVLLGRMRPLEMCRKRPRAVALSLPRFCSEPLVRAAWNNVSSAQLFHCPRYKNVCCTLWIYFSGNLDLAAM